MPRDINGNYTLPAVNPVAPQTIIDVAWANPTMADLAGALTDSLSRSGSGGMLSPFKNADGVQANPGISWVNEPTSGWYRAGVGDFWYAIGNQNIFRITANGVELAPGKNPIGFTSAIAIQDTEPVAKVGSQWFESDGGNLYMRYQNPDATFTWIAVNTPQVAQTDKIPMSDKGQPTGVATLDALGKLTATQAPTNMATLDGTGKLTITQLPPSVVVVDGTGHIPPAQLPAGSAGIYGQCRFEFISATTCRLIRWNGTFLNINGVTRVIPVGGVDILNTAVPSDVVHYIYAFWTGTAIALEASTLGYAAGPEGLMCKSGDGTRTLVGMVSKVSGNFFNNNNSGHLVLSWFNKKPLPAEINLAAAVQFSSVSFAEVVQSRIAFMTWANELVDGSAMFATYQGGGSQYLAMSLNVDGGGVGQGLTMYVPTQTGAIGFGTGTLRSPFYAGEGRHYLGVSSAVDAGSVWIQPSSGTSIIVQG